MAPREATPQLATSVEIAGLILPNRRRHVAPHTARRNATEPAARDATTRRSSRAVVRVDRTWIAAHPWQRREGCHAAFGCHPQEEAALAPRGARRRFDREAVAVHHRMSAQRRDARARHHDPDQGERVGGREADVLAAARELARLAQRVDRARQRELLAREAGDETAAARGAARLHAPQRPEDLALGDDQRLAGEQVVEDDAPAREQL